jgi:hypothetical protein
VTSNWCEGWRIWSNIYYTMYNSGPLRAPYPGLWQAVSCFFNTGGTSTGHLSVCLYKTNIDKVSWLFNTPVLPTACPILVECTLWLNGKIATVLNVYSLNFDLTFLMYDYGLIFLTKTLLMDVLKLRYYSPKLKFIFSTSNRITNGICFHDKLELLHPVNLIPTQ